MENLDSEDEEINKNLQGEVIDESKLELSKTKILPQGINNVPLSNSPNSYELYDAYFDSILAKTI